MQPRAFGQVTPIRIGLPARAAFVSRRIVSRNDLVAAVSRRCGVDVGAGVLA